MKVKPICAWITSHSPTKSQRRDLKAYEIIRLGGLRVKSAENVYNYIKMQCGRAPDLIVCALPKSTMHHLARVASCPVIIANMHYHTTHARPIWSGTWQKIIRLELVTESFIPQSGGGG